MFSRPAIGLSATMKKILLVYVTGKFTVIMK